MVPDALIYGFNYGVPTALIVMYIWKIEPALQNLNSAISGMATQIGELKEVQTSLREAIISGNLKRR